MVNKNIRPELTDAEHRKSFCCYAAKLLMWHLQHGTPAKRQPVCRTASGFSLIDFLTKGGRGSGNNIDGDEANSRGLIGNNGGSGKLPPTN